jgi:hypothetical protein
VRLISWKAAATTLLSWAAWTPAEGQVDSRLLTERWKDGDHWADTWDKPLVIPRGQLEDGGGGLQVFDWDSRGRIKVDRTERDPDGWIGYRVLTIDIHSRQEVLNHVFTDLALGFAAKLGSLGDQWMLSASAGAGTANDGRFDRTDTYYPVAAIDLARGAGDDPRWHVGLSLDGNRTLFPDAPLPYATFEKTVAPGLELRIGIPESQVVWKPCDSLTATALWEFPTNAFARLDMALVGGFGLLAEVRHQTDGFHLRDHEETRLFYELNTAEIGVRYIASWIDLSLSGGVAFDQKLFTGFDLRRRSSLASPEDRPFVALTAQGTF